MQSNNNNTNNALVLDFNARLLQELIAMRAQINQQGVQLNVLNEGFRQQFVAPPLLDDSPNDTNARFVLDTAHRNEVLRSQNKRGPRIIASNVTRNSRASPVQKYNGVLQHLHKLHHVSNVAALSNGQLKSRREKMHRAAKRVANLIFVLHPTLTHWKALNHLQDEQQYCNSNS
ncbi:hypothetical protein MUCCIDRAFT_166952 [Mucor lusitanicus CBS 277.49]|uniref:Uncharacterized protein n=1 Tax=Mucor lusitanicus CBS 277.49 TaxID=747725 RepID=A0A168I4E7_MUCCL|nr:hypothetical protein MUCCIDRAFT_166952 [Mucor lusitanicus CBS 277.49]